MNTLKHSQSPARRIVGALAVSALALGLSACGKKEEPTVGQRLDSAVEKTEQAAAEARAKTESLVKNAENKVEQGAATAKGAIDDAAITAQVNAGLAKDPDLSALKINVDTVNGAVTLKGPAPSAVARERAESIAKGVAGVTSVKNELVVTAG
ncbi:MAG: BON domain-containing protein [Acidovorax sp.]|uniref:BON domain-containing protein n=1 Tax=Acidovorax sp. TaxID=1872122 RepID=UPI0039E26ADF